MAKCEIGLIGLSVMGQNLALNIAEKGFQIAVYNRTASKTDDTVSLAKKQGIKTLIGHHSLEKFVQCLNCPRKIIFLVKAGIAVDQLIDQLIPLLSAEDIIIDGGNEWYELTQSRIQKTMEKKIHYMGMGISGGEYGARHGPALMPGGSKYAYDQIEHILKKIAAQANSEPCVSYIGKGGAGNYVKMVHNGIEYGDMELIAESYCMLKHLCGFSNKQLHAIFKLWNSQKYLKSYLIEITADIFLKKDPLNSKEELIDQILDVAGSKGTGMWTILEAARRGSPCPVIQAALDVRYLSAKKSERMKASEIYVLSKTDKSIDSHHVQDQLSKALFCAKLCSYSQGLALLKKTSSDEGWHINLKEVTKGWREGCIIRAELLDLIYSAYDESPDLESLLLSSKFTNDIKQCLPALKYTVTLALDANLPIPGFSAALSYINTYCNPMLPVNLIQAQRDYFGAHTYQRIDDPSKSFHTEWTEDSEI